MKFLASSGRLGCVAAIALITTVPTFALIKFDEGHDEIFVTGSAGMTYDSNIFASAEGSGDTSFNASLLLEYKRKAGMIGVDATAGWDFSKFSKFDSENFANPRLTAELTKASGRTTGDLRAEVRKENRADTAINVRTESWDYDAQLDLKYPVIERYSLAGNFGYTLRDFVNNDALVDIATYSAGLDLDYALNSQRQLLVGYRYRNTDTSVHTKDTDHAVTAGVTGKIIPKLNGTVRVGLQRRDIDRVNAKSEAHNSATASASVTWTLTSRLGLTGTAARDFSTVATDASVDTTSVNLDAQYAVNAKTSAFAGIGYGHLKFLDTSISGRQDDYADANFGFSYTYSDRLKFTAIYTFIENWSTVAASDYSRHSISLSASTHW